MGKIIPSICRSLNVMSTFNGKEGSEDGERDSKQGPREWEQSIGTEIRNPYYVWDKFCNCCRMK